MSIKKLLLFFSYNALMLIAFMTAVYAQNDVNSNIGVPQSLFPKGIGGAWKLNAAESDNVTEKVQKMMAGKNSASALPENSASALKELPSISISLFHPEMLMLVTDTDTNITINEGFKNVVLTRTILTDGNINIYELQPGANFTTKANWKNDCLTIETVSPRGNKMIEVYTPSPNGKKLGVNVRIENALSQELINLHRVYDRAVIDGFSVDDAEIQ